MGSAPGGCSLEWYPVDCKTVRIFAHSSTREQSHKGSGGRLGRDTKNKFPLASSVRIARFARVRKLLSYTKPILRKEPTVLQSRYPGKVYNRAKRGQTFEPIA